MTRVFYVPRVWSGLWWRKFSHCSCWDSNSQPFDHESGALTNKLYFYEVFVCGHEVILEMTGFQRCFSLFCHALRQHESAWPLVFEESFKLFKLFLFFFLSQCLLHAWNEIIVVLNYFGLAFCILDLLSYSSSIGKSLEKHLKSAKQELGRIFLSDTKTVCLASSIKWVKSY